MCVSEFGEVDEAAWIASNDLAFAVRDAHPVTPGHVLVVLRRPVAKWWDATAREQRALFDLVEIVKRRLDAEFSPDGYNIGFNSGAAAGQTIDQLHIHVIPRREGDVDDPRGGIRHVIPGKGNYLVPGPVAPTALPRLVTPAGAEFKLELLRALINPVFDRIDLLVAFVMRSGIDLIARHVDDALDRGAKIRLLTTDYLSITDTTALGYFLDRASDDGTALEARVFHDPATSFHPKAYLFSSSTTPDGVAFVGSSNLSRSALERGVEWNIRTRHVGDLTDQFVALWNDERVVPLTNEWLHEYERTRRERLEARSPGADEEVADDDLVAEAVDEEADAPQPWSVQREALAALESTRHEGHDAGLVVMATGLGKTWLAAFDSTRPEWGRVLFVAHREEILRQTRDVYRRIRPDGEFGWFGGGRLETEGDVVFASVQSLHRHLGEFTPEAFDYIVVDEFHHAAADGYRRLLAHFRPRFLLGLTATPDRTDAADLLALCGDNLVYDCGLVEGVTRGLLSPFTYRAIPDVADYEHIPWQSGRFDADELTTALSTQARADQVLEQWRERGGPERRTLAFCSTITHAEFMAERFRDAGVAAVALHSGPHSADRVTAVERLTAGDLQVIVTVDLFNEGVDIPDVDLVMLLRPTESPVVFFQQLGRGLRRAEGKERLDVVDLVGNHKSFLLKARLLAELTGRKHLMNREAVEFLTDNADDLAGGSADLPPGCSIIIEPVVIDLLRDLAGTKGNVDRLVELIREWVDAHDGQRPTALAMAIATGTGFALKAKGGWFGLLADAGLLSGEEGRALAATGEFLRWIEYGAFERSHALVTLRVLATTGNLHSGMLLDDVALACRWEVLGDPNLAADLGEMPEQFTDLANPTNAEWREYWRGPITALTAAARGLTPRFEVVDGRLRLAFETPPDSRAAFTDMVIELVDYRLHRHQLQRSSRSSGVQHKFRRGGVELDAAFAVEEHLGRPTSVIIHGAGGTRGTDAARNLDYVDGVDVLLERLRGLGVIIRDIYIDTTRTRDLTVAERRLDPNGLSYPLDLARLDDLIPLRKALLRSMGKRGQAPGSKGGGNSRKRTRFVVEVGGGWTTEAFADAVADGGSSRPRTRANPEPPFA